MHKQNVAREVYGLPGPLYFPFVFDRPSRVETAKEIIYEITDGKGSAHILLTYFPSYNSYEKPPLPDGAFFRSTWKRAWASDFRMDDF
mgnify:CR=1 FL=1